MAGGRLRRPVLATRTLLRLTTVALVLPLRCALARQGRRKRPQPLARVVENSSHILVISTTPVILRVSLVIIHF